MADKYQFDTSQSPTPPKSVGEYWATTRQLGGRAGFMEAFPQVYNPAYKWFNDAKYGVDAATRSALGAYSQGGVAEQAQS